MTRSKRRVLIVAYEVPPCGGSQRVAKFIKYLPASGWEPVVVSTQVENYGMTDLSLVEEMRGTQISRVGWIRLGARVRRIAARSLAFNSNVGPVSESGPFRLYRQLQAWNQLPDWAIGWVPPAVRQALRLVRANDAAVVYSVSPPYSAHLVGLIVSALTHRPWVVDFRDQWVENTDRRLPTRLHRQFHARLKSMIVHRADRVVTTTRLMTADLQARYPDIPAERFRTIMNGYDSADLPRGVEVNNQGFLAVHAGAFYAERTPEQLFKGLSALRNRNPTLSRQLRIELYGPKDERTLHLIKAMDLGDLVRHGGYLPHGEVLRRLATANLLLLVVHNNDVGRIAIPAKVFEYLALSRPLLAVAPLDAEVAGLLRESCSSSVVAPGDVEGIADAIEGAYDQSTRGGTVKGNEAFVRRFDRAKLTQELAALFDEVTGAATTSPAGRLASQRVNGRQIDAI